MKNLFINPQVYDDLKEIREYISKDSAEQAEKVVRKIYDDIKSLSEMPERGLNLRNKVKQKTKYKYILTFKHFATLYYVTDEAVYVSLVLHTAKDLSVLALIEPFEDNK